MIQLSLRLHTIAQLIPNGAKVADIGSDHAYLPAYLVQSGKSRYVIAGEVNDGPYESAKRNIKQLKLEEYVYVRKGNGLEVIQPNEVDTIVIAGMGGSLITQILLQGLTKLEGVSRLILQPNVGENFVRMFAISHGWELTKEVILEEDGVIYEILDFTRGDSLRPYRDSSLPFPFLVKLGPFLMQENSPLFRKKWQRELSKMEVILQQLQKSTNPEAVEKRMIMQEEYEQIKELLSL